MLKIYNTLSKKTENFIPRQDKRIQMFVCGPTVYDYVHIGNARVFVLFDSLAKFLVHRGYEVTYIQNITDIDDKIIKRASEDGVNPLELAKDYTDKFKIDMEALGVTSPSYAPATSYIPEVLKQVKGLIDKNCAYEIPQDGWYFDLSSFPSYGKLSGRTAQMADDAVSRIDDSDKKRNKGDFCIWKFSKEGEPSWSPKDLGFPDIASGRPGWHIEDTAITEHFFGPQYDIHGGGQDLIFPHHEAEIAQQESISGKTPFVNYWIHVAFLVSLSINQSDSKMSKSAGNFKTVNELLKKYPGPVLRFYLLSNHYKTPLQFSDQALYQAQAGVQRISEFVSRLRLASGSDNPKVENITDEAYDKFFEALNNDFNVPEAFSAIFEMIRTLNPILTSNEMSSANTQATLSFMNEINKILGIIQETKTAIPLNIKELVEKREELRNQKNFSQSDKIRSEVEKLGWHIEDTIYGPIILENDGLSH